MTTKTITEAQLAASHPEAFCGRCGGSNPSWHAASPLWNAVMRAADREPFDGIVCPSCFAFLAAEGGITEHMCLTTHDALVPLATTFGDGRVWDAGLCRWVETNALPATGLDVEPVWAHVVRNPHSHEPALLPDDELAAVNHEMHDLTTGYFLDRTWIVPGPRLTSSPTAERES